MKPFRNTLLLGLLVILALGWLLWDYDKSEKEKSVKESNAKIFSLEKNAITGFKIATTSHSIEVSKVLGQWALNAPVKDAVDESAVEGFIDTMLREKSEEIVEEGDGVQWSIYGLDKPLGTISLLTEGGAERSVQVGSIKAFDGRRYLRKSGENQVLSGASLWSTEVEKKSKDFRLKKILVGPTDQIHNVHIHHGKIDIVLKEVENKWQFLNSKTPVDGSLVMGYIDKIKNLVATDFSAEKKDDSETVKKFGFAKEGPFISLVSQKSSEKESDKEGAKTTEETSWQLNLSSFKDNKGYAFVSNREPIMEFSESSLKALLVEADYFRDKKAPFQFPKDQIEKLELKIGKVELHLSKAGDKWNIEGSSNEKQEVNTEKLDQFLGDILQLEAAQIVAAASPNTKVEENQITLKNKSNELVLRINWGGKYKDKVSPSEEYYFVRTHNSKDIYGVKINSLDSLAKLNLTQEKKPESPVSATDQKQSTNSSQAKNQSGTPTTTTK